MALLYKKRCKFAAIFFCEYCLRDIEEPLKKLKGIAYVKGIVAVFLYNLYN